MGEIWNEEKHLPLNSNRLRLGHQYKSDQQILHTHYTTKHWTQHPQNVLWFSSSGFSAGD